MDKKKIIKGIGVGTLSCVAMVGLTGCANVEIPQEKVYSMVETVSKAEKYMEDQLKLLEEQNNKLQEQNEILKKENNKFTKQDAADKVNLSQIKILLNQGGILNNLKLTSIELSGVRNESYYYVTENGTRMLYNYAEMRDGDYHSVIYDIDGMNTAVCEWIYNGDVSKEIILNSEGGFFSGKLFGYSGLHSMAMFLLNITSEDVVSCEKLEGNKYNVVVYKNTGIVDIGSIYANIILDEDNRILSMTTGVIDFSDMDNIYFEEDSCINFEYNTITENDIDGVLKKAQNKQCQEEAILLYNQAYRHIIRAETIRVDRIGTNDVVEQFMQLNIKDNKAYITGNAQTGETMQEWYQKEGENWFDYVTNGINYNKHLLTDSNLYTNVFDVVEGYCMFMGGEVNEENLSSNNMLISHEYMDGEVKITLTFCGELDEGDGPIVATIKNGRFVETEATFDAGTIEVKNTYSFDESSVDMVELPDVDWVLIEN
ncbi:MAG: hypothetical protein IKM43_01615 [Clostridia bacterium]|nr:hypothetical protein [Clostridia bacterium]